MTYLFFLFRFGGEEFPPMIFFKIFIQTGVQKVKYLSGRKMIKPATEVLNLLFFYSLLPSRSHYESFHRKKWNPIKAFDMVKTMPPKQQFPPLHAADVSKRMTDSQHWLGLNKQLCRFWHGLALCAALYFLLRSLSNMWAWLQVGSRGLVSEFSIS